MRKIPPEYENCIDHQLISFADTLCPLFKKLNFTANGITTLSLIFGLLSIYYLYKDQIYVFGILYFISYFFDCMDGHFARKYDQVTKFGDYYDHFKDILIFLLIVGTLYYKNKNCKTNIIILSCILGIAFILFNIHMGCQEKIYDSEESPTLHFQKQLCPGDPYKTIQFTNWFGSGTFVLLFIVIVMYVEHTKICPF